MKTSLIRSVNEDHTEHTGGKFGILVYFNDETANEIVQNIVEALAQLRIDTFGEAAPLVAPTMRTPTPEAIEAYRLMSISVTGEDMLAVTALARDCDALVADWGTAAEDIRYLTLWNAGRVEGIRQERMRRRKGVH